MWNIIKCQNTERLPRTNRIRQSTKITRSTSYVNLMIYLHPSIIWMQKLPEIKNMFRYKATPILWEKSDPMQCHKALYYLEGYYSSPAPWLTSFPSCFLVVEVEVEGWEGERGAVNKWLGILEPGAGTRRQRSLCLLLRECVHKTGRCKERRKCVKCSGLLTCHVLSQWECSEKEDLSWALWERFSDRLLGPAPPGEVWVVVRLRLG